MSSFFTYGYLCFYLCYCLFSLQPMQAQQPEKPFVIVVASYKNAKWHAWNLDSILTQDYGNYRVIYVDDCSPDGTADQVADYVQQHYPDANFTLVRNTTRLGAMANLYHAIHSCNDDEIIATVDGDDALAHADVLKDLNTIYNESQTWFTHGCLMEYPAGNVTWSEPVPVRAIENRTIRKFKCPSHLRTFYTWLFKQIKREDFMDEQGKWLWMAWDMAIMFPMVEMAGHRHAYVDKVSYLYNMVNPINDNKVDPQLQNQLDQLIRNRKPYPYLAKSPLD